VREFDKAYTTPLSNRVRLRFGCDIERGTVTRFLVQLEYHMADGWTPIVRSDHNPPAVDGHDVEREGVHMDLYCDGEQVETRQIAPPMHPNAGLNCAEDHLVRQDEQHITRFEQWHNLNPNSNR
jgi:hypothetical protein